MAKYKLIPVNTPEVKATFTTGQVSGMTWTTTSTLLRYTREFPEMFTEEAKKHTKGRRWSQSDLEAIQAIRTLHQSRLGHDKTAEVLASGWRPAINTESDRETYSRLAQTIYEIAKEAETELKNHRNAVNLAFERYHHIEGELEQLRYELESIRESRITKWFKRHKAKPTREAPEYSEA